MRKLILVTLVLIVKLSYSQNVPKDSAATIKLTDITSCIQAFDLLDSCTKYEAIRNTAITGLQSAITERDTLLKEKDANYALLLSSKEDLEGQLLLRTGQFNLSELNYGLLKKKKNKQLIGGIAGSFFAGVGVGIIAGIFIPKLL